MRKVTITLLLFFITFYCLAQTPGIRWQRTLGGSSDDAPAFSFKTTDNNFITVFKVYSNNGDITGNHGQSDIWIVKMNILGQIQWTRTIGGTADEIPVAYHYNTDGTFLIVSNTYSNNGDVTGNHGNSDILVNKFSAEGVPLWHKCFGGSSVDFVSGILKGLNGTYTITASTLSNNGDITGYHGAGDLWVFNINELGALQWQIALGGSSSEVFNVAAKTIQAPDGSYYVGTATYSNNGDVSGSAGNGDLWLVKLNSTGVFQWQKCMGGTSSEYFSDIQWGLNGEVFICGKTESTALPNFHGTSGTSDIFLCRVSVAGTLVSQRCYGGTSSDDPTQLVTTFADGSCLINSTVYFGGGDIIGSHGSGDIWFFKVASSGSIEWQQTLGGSSYDGVFGGFGDGPGGTGIVLQTIDQGFIIPGFTSSTDGDVTGYHPSHPLDSSQTDIWIVKLSSTGAPEWQRSLGGSRGEYPRGAVLELGSNDYIVTGYTNSSDGDIQEFKGVRDAWTIRLASVNTVTGALYYDQNLNGVKDSGEPFFSDARVKTEKTGDTRISSPVNGLFKNETDIGNYTTTVQIPQLYYTIVPSSHLSSFTTYFNKDSFSFAIQPIPGIKDLVINAMPLAVARPGFNVSYRIFYKNAGTTAEPSGQILFKKDPRLTFNSATPAISSSNGDTLKWNYSNLQPLDLASITINFTVQTPPTVNNGDTLLSIGIITPVTGDQTPADDTIIVKQVARGSFDPNDKYEKNEGKITSAYISNGNYLDYLVRFQNLGTDTAFNVEVLDTLSSKLDLSTLQVIASSHSYKLTLTGNILKWTFYNIKLPHSSVNEPASHGYIAYRIKPLNTVAIGDIIDNSASIYFDFNLPVKTNIASTVVIGSPVSTPLPTITSFTPTNSGAGGSITITGTNFTGASAVSFGGVAASSFTVNSATNITAVVGTGASGNISVITPGGTATLAGFTFIPAPTITSFTPTSGAANASITITGTNFTGATAVSFGGVAASSFTVNSATSITAVVGTGASGSISVTTSGGIGTLAGFTFIPAPTITSFTPTSGAANASIIITGTNFTGATAVGFGGIAASSFTVNSATSITAVVGTGASGSVSVTTPGGTATLAGFTFIPAPTITSFTPTSGAANTSITITGTNFTGATAVSFGGAAASSFTVNSATSITAVVGTGASGSVSVTTPGGTATLAGFTFIPAPTITSFTPASGAANASITITGTNFTGATAVSFGGAAASSFTANSATSITAVVGTGASGSISVTTPGGTGILAGFTFISGPTITSFSPASGGAGTTITITGTNFTGATGVTIGGVAASSFTVNGSTSITAVVGTGASGNIIITVPSGTVTSPEIFTFIPAPTITSFTPTNGGTGAVITITGTNFTAATAVSFGGIAASSFTVNSATSITAIVGAGASGSVTVTTPGGTATLAGFTFNTITGINTPSVNSVELRIYPNPITDLATILHPSSNKNAQIRLIDITGRTVKIFVPVRNTTQTPFDSKLLSAGIYNLVWSDGSRMLSRTLMIK